jgi:hypothetical protein
LATEAALLLSPEATLLRTTESSLLLPAVPALLGPSESALLLAAIASLLGSTEPALLLPSEPPLLLATEASLLGSAEAALLGPSVAALLLPAVAGDASACLPHHVGVRRLGCLGRRRPHQVDEAPEVAALLLLLLLLLLDLAEPCAEVEVEQIVDRARRLLGLLLLLGRGASAAAEWRPGLAALGLLLLLLGLLLWLAAAESE